MIPITLDPADLGQRTVGDLVTEDYRRAAAFKNLGIDFCCGGGATLASVCAKKGIALADVADALRHADARGTSPQARVEHWSPSFLADYVVNEHHTYVRESIPVLRAFTQKVARVHGQRHPELVEIAELFEQVATGLEGHMVCEEQIVFPAIKALASGGPAPETPLADVLREMEGDHDEAGEAMRQIRELSSDFTPPPDACNTYRAAFVKLEEFEDDLHRHVHLENNILFPKALALSPDAEEDVASQETPVETDAAATAEPSKTLDVRVIPPPQKHPAIFSVFDALDAGDHFVLVNDHDPVPLRYQLEFTRPGAMGWEYLEQGPELWRVKISKMADAAA